VTSVWVFGTASHVFGVAVGLVFKFLCKDTAFFHIFEPNQQQFSTIFFLRVKKNEKIVVISIFFGKFAFR